MSGFSLKQAFGREKPHSSVTDWIDIMTAIGTPEESFEGTPELVDAINLQASGPAEAVRALRKKMKHGSPHHQYRSIVIMRALLENFPAKMKVAFADSQFMDALKGLAQDPYVDKRVKKKLILVLAAWREEFSKDPSMATYAALYDQLKGSSKHRVTQDDLNTYIGIPTARENKAQREEEQQSKEREKERKDKEKKQRNRKEDRERNRDTRRKPFDFERDKQKVLNSIVEASQASSNLINAITLVNLENDSLETNERVQTCVTQAKSMKKVITRYTQLVENEELIGTLIETYERLEAALDTYDRLCAPDDADAVATGLAKASITDQELSQLQAEQHAAVQRVKHDFRDVDTGKEGEKENKRAGEREPYVHPDLRDLDFGATAKNLPPPLRPMSVGEGKFGRDPRRASLSDFSSYASSDEDDYGYDGNGIPKRKNYVTVSDNEDGVGPSMGKNRAVSVSPSSNGVGASVANDDDPFADPFADQTAISHTHH